MRRFWVINRFNDPNYGDIGICRSLTQLLVDKGYEVHNFDFIGKRLKFQFTRVLYILSLLPLVLREKPEFLLIGGGQLLLNNRNFPYAMLGWYLLSKLARVPLIVFSVGTELNGREGPFYRCVLKLFLENAKKVYLRDSLSVDAVYRMTGLRFDTVPDAVYLSYKKNDGTKTNSSRVLVFVSLNSVPEGSIDDHYGRICEAIYSLGCTDVTVAISSEQDEKAAKDFLLYVDKRRPGFSAEFSKPANFDDFYRHISQSDIVISSRMHPIIYAHYLEKEFVAIPTNMKTQEMSIMLQNSCPSMLSDEVLNKLLAAIACR